MAAVDDPHLPRAALIDAYGNGGFRFAEMSHRGSLLCLPDSMRAWDVSDPRQIDAYSLKLVFASAARIDTLLIGTGTTVWLAPTHLRDLCRANAISLDTMQTGPAIRTYNVMIAERRRVAAAMIAVP